MVPVLTHHMSPLVSLTLTVSNENDNDNHSYDSNRNHKTNVSKRIKKHDTTAKRARTKTEEECGPD